VLDNSFSFLVGPGIAMAVLGGLMLALRWAFTPSRPRTGRPVPAREGADYGLLQPVATVPTSPQALAVRATLSDAGIRSTTRPERDGRTSVLVFAPDRERARLLVPPGTAR